MKNRVTIVGGGATGVLLAVNLLKNAGDRSLELNIVERKNRLGRGVAYSAVTDFHLLNVPAAKMGAFPAAIDDFYVWLQENNYDFAPNDFVPRKIYGEYISDVLRRALEEKSANTTVNLINDEATDIAFADDSYTITTASGKTLDADKVVLAFGNFLPAHPNVSDRAFINAEKYSQNPWDEEFFDKLAPTDEILLIGTGLTMADTTLSLYKRRHQGKILAVSRHGLLPAAHKLGFSYPSFEDEMMREEKILPLLKIVRRHAARAARDSDWRAVIDSLRPFTQKLWLQLSLKEKRRFLRHLNTIWNVLRHRLPNSCASILEEMQQTGNLEIDHGKIRCIAADRDGKFTVDYGDKTTRVDAIINCTGSQTDFRRVDTPFVKNLLEKGFVRPDALALGLEALPTGEIIDENGAPSRNLYTLGTSLKGILWESTAMPELRAQAEQLALNLLQKTDRASAGH